MSEKPFFSCKIPGRARILKNGKKICFNRKTGARFIATSDRFTSWAAFAKVFIDRARSSETFDGHVHLKVLFYLKNHQHEPDLSNALQGIEDLLQKCGVIKNDKLIVSLDGSRKIFDPECTERVEIEVFTVE